MRMKTLIALLFVVLMVGGCVEQTVERVEVGLTDTEFFGPQERINNENFKWSFSYYYYIDGKRMQFTQDDVEIHYHPIYRTEYDSMMPFSGIGSKLIYMEYEKAKKIKPIERGDVIRFFHSGSIKPTVHRVVKVGEDNKGIYYLTKGDNVWYVDNVKVRESQIDLVVVGVLY